MLEIDLLLKLLIQGRVKHNLKTLFKNNRIINLRNQHNFNAYSSIRLLKTISNSS